MRNNGSPVGPREAERLLIRNPAEQFLKLLREALERDPEKVQFGPLNRIVDVVRRQNLKRAADVRFHCPDEWAKNLAGHRDRQDIYWLVRIDRELADAICSPVARPDTSLVLPGG